MRSDAMRRVSSQVRARAAPAGASFPLISTSGGLPGVKKRSLIFDDVLNIVARSAGVAIGATAGAAAVAATGAVLMAAYLLVLRHQPKLVLPMTATLAILSAVRDGLQHAYPAALAGSFAAASLIALAAYTWIKISVVGQFEE